MKNHLFIGLGGQGGRSLAELRKVIEQRNRDAAQLKDRKLKWEFLSIDSSSDIWNAGKGWKYFGKDVSLTDRQKVALDRLSQAGGLSIRPDISPWIGESAVVDGYLEKNHRIEGANQRRRFGRLLFANNADQIRMACRDHMRLLTEGSDNKCWIHVFASLAGGTGSGGIVDLVAMLRSMFPNGDTENGFPIFLYLFVTHNEGSAADVGYFYQNQYAALRDLNALACGRLRPNLLGSADGGELLAESDPITNLSLYTSLNSRNVNQPLDNQIRIAAESCFERIHAFATGGLSPTCQKAITGQDILASFGGEPVSHPERSYRFASSGMRRWEVPSEKISEAMSLDLVVSGLNQMLHHTWQDSSGFADVLLELPEARLQLHRSTLEEILTRRKLASSTETLGQELRRELEKIERGVLNSPENERTPGIVEERFSDFFHKQFQGGGIKAFLTNIAANRKAALKEAIAEVDAYLTRAWSDVSQPVGLGQIPSILSSLKLLLDQKLSAHQDNATHRARLTTKLQARQREWLKLTKLSSLLGKRSALLAAHARDTRSELTYTLQDLCHAQDVEFQKDFLTELQRMEAAYQVASRAIQKLKSEAASERDEIFAELYAMRNADGANRYEFELPALERFRKELRQHRAHQEQAAFLLRAKLVPDGMTLTRFQADQIRGNLEVSLEAIENDIRQAGLERIHSIHHEFASAGTISPVLDVSLLDRLEQKFTGNEALLASESREFVSLAASSLLIDSNQIQPAVLLGGQVGVPPMPKRVMVLGIPRHRYAETLRKAFMEVIPAGQAFVTDVYTHDDPTQLRLLVMDYWMAARFSVTVKELSKKYEAAVKQGGTNNLRYFCNIDPVGENGGRPDLFLPAPEELRAKLEAGLWLGRRLREPVVTEDENGMFLLSETTEGKNIEQIGQNMGEVIASANLPLMMKVEMRIKNALRQVDDAERAALKTEIRVEEERLLASHKQTSPEFQKWVALRGQINSILN